MYACLVDVTRLAPIQTRATARESFTASMRLLGKAYRGRLGKILRPLLGRAQADENLREAVRTRWVEPRRQAAREAVRRACRVMNSVPASILMLFWMLCTVPSTTAC